MRHVAQVHGQGRKDDASVTQSDGASNLFHRLFNRPNGDDALRNKSLARCRPIFNQPVVVRLHARQLELVVLDPSERLSG
jgi:hypothetical protein